MAAMGDSDDDQGSGKATAGSEYAERLTALETARWKRVLDVQRPYRWNLRRLHLGRTLDVGCGIGRNLGNLGQGSVGVDHNATSIETAWAQGHEAYTLQEWEESPVRQSDSFDSLLIAHVIEHMDEQAGD